MPDEDAPASQLIRCTEKDIPEPGSAPRQPGAAGTGLRCQAHNRVHTVMVHTTRYSFQGQARLAYDVGCSRSTISRLVNQRSRPSFALVQAVTAALERSLGKGLDPRELFSSDGTYPTPSGCALCGCSGCMPEEAFDRHGNLKPAFRNLRPGDWSLSPRRTLITQNEEDKRNHIGKGDR